MANRNMAFSPADGLRNKTTYVTNPADEDAAREQVQGRLDEIRDHINEYVSMHYDDTGSANAYAVTMASTISAYSVGMKLSFKASNANTGASTLNVTPSGGSALGAKAIKKNGNEDLIGGDIKAGQIVEVEYDGTNFQLLSPTAYNAETVVERDRGFSLDLPYYYQRNIKQIATCEADEGWQNNSWDGYAGTYSADTTNYKVGSAGAKMSTSSTYGGIHLVKAMDLSKFNDGSPSSNDDYICIVLNTDATSIANLGAYGLLLSFPVNTVPTITDRAYFGVSGVSLTAGYNYIKIKKSDISQPVGFSWANVKGFSVQLSFAASGTVNVTLDNIQLIRKDPLENKPNPFQRQINGVWTRDFTINSGEWFVGEEFGEIVCRDLSGSYGPFLLQGNKLFGNFESILKFNISNGSYYGGIGFYVNNDNYVYIYNNANILHVVCKINGTQNVTTYATSYSNNDTVTQKLSRNGSKIYFEISKNGEVTDYSKSLEFINNDGVIAFGRGDVSSVYENIQSLAITTTSYASEAGNAHATDRNAVLYNAGAFTANTLPEGKYGIDTTNHRLYVKYPDGTVKYVALT